MQLRIKLAAMTAAGSAAALLFAGGSAMASTHTVHRASRVTGREVITHAGHESWAEATKPGELLPLRLRGVVRTRGGVDLGGRSRRRDISTRAGSLILWSLHRSISNRIINRAHCRLQTTVIDHFVVRGRSSTGRFAHASGRGVTVVRFRFDYPRVNGRCDFRDPGRSRGGRVSFLLVIPRLTVH
jgi:hypothetical protein